MKHAFRVAVLAIVLALAPVTAQAADNSYWLTNGSSALHCYVYKGGAWHQINKGHTFKGMTRSTRFKCNRDWYARSALGVAVTGKLTKNKVYHWSSIALKRLGSFRWAVAFKW